MSNVSDFLATKTLPPVPLIGSNGFFNRKMFTAPGLHSLIVPPGVFRVKLANLGGGGSGGGAYTNYYTNKASAYGGGGGGLAILHELVVAPGDVLDIVVASGGDAVTAPNVGPFRLVGNPGGITSISRNGIVLLQATGGLGGPSQSFSNTQPANLLELGGVGSLGDINTKGGGCLPFTSYTNTTYSGHAPSGGGSSGTPWGDGHHGGTGPCWGGSSGAYIDVGAGAGWGQDGGPGNAYFSASQPRFASQGGGTLEGYITQKFAVSGSGQPNVLYILGGTGRNAGEVITVHMAIQTGTNPYENSKAFAFIGANDWWDLGDIGGWGGGYRIDAGPGGGGGGNQGSPAGLPGFGGGGAGGHNDRAQDGGIGAGGGAYIGTNTSNSSGKGGDGCAIVWW